MKIECVYITMEYFCQKKIRKLNYRGGDGKELKKETLSQLGTVTLESHDRLAKGSEVLLHG